MIERDNLLNSNLLPRRFVKSGADHAVCALANNILDVILLADVEGDLAGSGLRRSARHCGGGCVMKDVGSVGDGRDLRSFLFSGCVWCL